MLVAVAYLLSREKENQWIENGGVCVWGGGGGTSSKEELVFFRDKILSLR